jgi:hypothetical protein
MKPTIDSISSYLDLLPEEQLQEVFKFTQNLFIRILLNKVSVLPENKQQTVLEFIEYLLEKTKINSQCIDVDKRVEKDSIPRA